MEARQCKIYYEKIHRWINLECKRNGICELEMKGNLLAPHRWSSAQAAAWAMRNCKASRWMTWPEDALGTVCGLRLDGQANRWKDWLQDKCNSHQKESMASNWGGEKQEPLTKDTGPVICPATVSHPEEERRHVKHIPSNPRVFWLLFSLRRFAFSRCVKLAPLIGVLRFSLLAS